MLLIQIVASWFMFGCPEWAPGAVDQGLLHCQAQGHKRQPNLASVYFISQYLYVPNEYLLSLCQFQFLQYQTKRLARKNVSKMMFCVVLHKTLTRSHVWLIVFDVSEVCNGKVSLEHYLDLDNTVAVPTMQRRLVASLFNHKLCCRILVVSS